MAGFTLSLTRDSLNMSSASTCDPSLPVFPKYEIAVISRAKSVPRGAWISLFKRNKRFVTRRGIEPGPPGSKVIAVPMRLRRQAYQKRSKIAYIYLIYSKTLKMTEITYSY